MVQAIPLLLALTAHHFGAVDWTILAVYAGSLLAIGFYFSRQGQTAEEYFLGGRRTPPWLAGISLFTALTSIITYIGTPGEYIQYGPVLVFTANLIVLPFVQLIVGRLLIPHFMRLPITSAYELLEVRLGRAVRQAGSIGYIATRFVWMALILYTSSSVLVHVIGCDPRWSTLIVLVIAAVTTTYTLVGGLRTVMITEAVQFFLLLTGAVLTIVSITVSLGGVGRWWPTHWEPTWPTQPFFRWDPHVRVTIVATFLFQLVGTVCSAGSDQAAIQRFLSTRDARSARRAFWLNNLAVIGVVWVLGLVGMALLGFYRAHPEAVGPHLDLARDGDALFPLYISQYLPVGISGLVVASLMAMAMSCLAAGISALITIITKDFIEIGRDPKIGAGTDVAPANGWLAIGIGAVVVLGTFVVGSVRGDIYEVAGKTVTLLGAPLFGLFFLAMFVPSATSFGAIMGAIYSTVSAILVAYWDVLTGKPGFSFLWVGPASLVVSLGASWLFSRLPTRGRTRGALAAWSGAVLAPLAAVVAWLLATA